MYFCICENSHKSFSCSIKSGLALEIIGMEHHLSVVSLSAFDGKVRERALIHGCGIFSLRISATLLQGERGALVTVNRIISAGLH